MQVFGTSALTNQSAIRIPTFGWAGSISYDNIIMIRYCHHPDNWMVYSWPAWLSSSGGSQVFILLILFVVLWLWSNSSECYQNDNHLSAQVGRASHSSLSSSSQFLLMSRCITEGSIEVTASCFFKWKSEVHFRGLQCLRRYFDITSMSLSLCNHKVSVRFFFYWSELWSWMIKRQIIGCHQVVL